MDEDIFSIPEVPKKGIGNSGKASSPAPHSEPSISSAKSDTGSHPTVNTDVTDREEPNSSSQTLKSASIATTNPRRPPRKISKNQEQKIIELRYSVPLRAPKKRTKCPIRISKRKGETVIELHKKGISYPKIARELGLRTGGIRSFLRRRGMTGKQRTRPISAEMLRDLYCVQGLSMDRIAKRIGMPRSNVEYWMKKHKIARRTLRKYARHPFSGDDCEKAYMIGFRQGDLHAMREGLGVRISGTTTHPAQIALFRRIFEKYGQIYAGPVYNQVLRQYSWQMVVALDDSFSFLLPKFNRIPRWIRRNSKTALYFVVGFFDAEGHITVVFNDRRGSKTMELAVMISNSNRELLQEIAWILRNYRPRIYLSERQGTAVGPNRTILRKDQWKLAVYRQAAQEKLLVALPLRHQEKVDKASIALEVLQGCDWNEARRRVEELWQRIEHQVAEQARLGALRLQRRDTGLR